MLLIFIRSSLGSANSIVSGIPVTSSTVNAAGLPEAVDNPLHQALRR